MADPERPERRLELGRRAAIPVGRVLEPVRVEVERAGQMAVRVFLGDTEVDVEQEVLPVPERVGAAAVDQLAHLLGVDELLVVGQLLDRVPFVSRPGREPGLVSPDIAETRRVEARP